MHPTGRGDKPQQSVVCLLAARPKIEAVVVDVVAEALAVADEPIVEDDGPGAPPPPLSPRCASSSAPVSVAGPGAAGCRRSSPARCRLLWCRVAGVQTRRCCSAGVGPPPVQTGRQAVAIVRQNYVNSRLPGSVSRFDLSTLQNSKKYKKKRKQENTKLQRRSVQRSARVFSTLKWTPPPT